MQYQSYLNVLQYAIYVGDISLSLSLWTGWDRKKTLCYYLGLLNGQWCTASFTLRTDPTEIILTVTQSMKEQNFIERTDFNWETTLQVATPGRYIPQ